MLSLARKKPSAGRRRSRSGSAPLVRAQSKLPRVDVVFNPVSGVGDPASERAEIEKTLGKGYHVVRFHETTVDVGAAELARGALEDGAVVIVASGGDGTVTAVADAIRRHVHGGGWGEQEKAEAPAVGTADVPGAPEVAREALAAEVEEEEAVKLVLGRRNEEAAAGAAAAAAGAPSDAREDVRLGVIPRGTANAFCAAIGIPSDLTAAAALVNRATPRRVDMAMVNGSEPMLLLCGIGLEAEVVQRADRSFKSRFGAAAYFLAGISSVARQKRFRVSLVLHDVRQRTRVGGVKGAELAADVVRLTGVEVAAVTIANSAPPTSVLAQGIGDVQPDDGLLEVVCVAPAGRFATVVSMLSMLKSALLRQRGVARPEVYGLRARRVELVCEPPQRIVIDGEDAGLTPVVVEIDADVRRRQISVIAPKAGALNRRRRRMSRALLRAWRNARGLVMLSGLVWGVRLARGLQRGGARDRAVEER